MVGQITLVYVCCRRRGQHCLARFRLCPFHLYSCRRILPFIYTHSDEASQPSIRVAHDLGKAFSCPLPCLHLVRVAPMCPLIMRQLALVLSGRCRRAILGTYYSLITELMEVNFSATLLRYACVSPRSESISVAKVFTRHVCGISRRQEIQWNL